MADNNGAAAVRVPRPKVVQPKPTNKAAPPTTAVAPTAVAPPAQGPAIQNSVQPTTSASTSNNNNNNNNSAAAGPSSRPLAPKIVSSVGSGSSILAHPQQKGNPLLKELTHQRWEHAEIAPDYHIAQSTCALFLQLKYHRLHPEYIHQRIKAISGMYSHRLLILQHDVDASSSEPAIRELTKISIVNNLTLLLAWTPQEAAQWLEKYKMCEFKGAELIRGRPKETQRERMSDVLTQPTGVNKADATALMAKFGSIRNISQATADDLSDIPGMGEIKIKRLREAFTTPFRTDERRTYRERKAARLEEEGGRGDASLTAAENEDLDAQEALDGLGGDDGPGGFLARSADKNQEAQSEPRPPAPPPDEFGDLSDEGFELNEEELALLEAPTGGSSTANGARRENGAEASEKHPDAAARLHAQAQSIHRQRADLEGDDEDLDALLPSEDTNGTAGEGGPLSPRRELQPAERALQREEDEEAGAQGGGEVEGMDGLTQEEREELRRAMEMSLAGEDEE